MRRPLRWPSRPAARTPTGGCRRGRADGLVAPAAEAAAHGAAAGAGLPRLGLVDRQAAAADRIAVQPGDGRLGLAGVLHLDEAEALRPARVAVVDDLRGP